MPAVAGRMGGADMSLRSKKCRKRPMPLPAERNYDFGGAILPPIFSQVPLATYFQEIGSLSAVLCPAQACLPAAQSFWPALAMPKHLSLLASGATGAAETDAASPSASRPATAAWIVVCSFMKAPMGIESFCKKTSNGDPCDLCRGGPFCAHLALWSCG